MRRLLKWGGIAIAGFIVLIIVLAVIFSDGGEETLGLPTPTSKPTSTPTRAPIPTATFEESKIRALSLSYDELFRNNEQHEGKLVFFEGEIEQVNDRGSNEYLLRAYVTRDSFGFSDDDVRLDYQGSRVLEDDVVEFVASVEGFVGIYHSPWCQENNPSSQGNTT